TQSLKELSGLIGELDPGGWSNKRLHVTDPFDRPRVAPGPVESERRPPVVYDKRHVLASVESVERLIEMAAVLLERVRSWTAVGQLVRIAHPDQIWRYAASQSPDVRYDVAPDV